MPGALLIVFYVLCPSLWGGSPGPLSREESELRGDSWCGAHLGPSYPHPSTHAPLWGAVCTEAHAGASASHLLWANVTRQRVSCQSSAALFRRAQVLKFFPTLLAGRAAPHQAPLFPCLEVAPAPVRLTRQEGESREVAVDSLACWKLGFQERPLFCSWKKNQAE